MDWHKHFEKVFFESWQNAGFGYPQDYVSKYIEIREHSDSKSDWIKIHQPSQLPLMAHSFTRYMALAHAPVKSLPKCWAQVKALRKIRQIGAAVLI